MWKWRSKRLSGYYETELRNFDSDALPLWLSATTSILFRKNLFLSSQLSSPIFLVLSTGSPSTDPARFLHVHLLISWLSASLRSSPIPLRANLMALTTCLLSLMLAMLTVALFWKVLWAESKQMIDHLVHHLLNWAVGEQGSFRAYSRLTFSLRSNSWTIESQVEIHVRIDSKSKRYRVDVDVWSTSWPRSFSLSSNHPIRIPLSLLLLKITLSRKTCSSRKTFLNKFS